MRSSYILCAVLALANVEAEDVVVRSSNGEFFVFNIMPEDSFLGTINILQQSVGNNGEYVIDFMNSTPDKLQTKAKVEGFRDYNTPLTTEEKKDIKYIVNTLGMDSLVSITSSKSSIKKAGKRVDHVHPLRFLGYVFSDEEMKASMKAMEGRSWVWSEFSGGLKDSLEVESSRNNLKPEYVNDFASRVGINIEVISPSINQHSWDTFISTLISKVPRSTDTRRYNDV